MRVRRSRLRPALVLMLAAIAGVSLHGNAVAEEDLPTYQAIPWYGRDGSIVYWDCSGSCPPKSDCCKLIPRNPEGLG